MAKDPLHGLTLQVIVEALVAHFGWEELGKRIAIKCFTTDPSISSSLKFLRKTPWARAKVESLYLFMLREKSRAARRKAREEGAAAANATDATDATEATEATDATDATGAADATPNDTTSKDAGDADLG